MNDALKMQISAFVDGELPDAEAELLTRRLSQDESLRQQAAAYLEIGRLMRGERALPAAKGLRERVAAALENEAPAYAEPVASGGRWLRPAAGMAIAASVAMLALIGLRQVDPGDVAISGSPVPTAAIAVDDGIAYTEPAPSEVLADQPNEMLRQYLISHGQTSGELGANGILHRLVTLELRGGELVQVTPEGEALESGDAAVDNDESEGAQEE